MANSAQQIEMWASVCVWLELRCPNSIRIAPNPSIDFWLIRSFLARFPPKCVCVCRLAQDLSSQLWRSLSFKAMHSSPFLLPTGRWKWDSKSSFQSSSITFWWGEANLLPKKTNLQMSVESVCINQIPLSTAGDHWWWTIFYWLHPDSKLCHSIVFRCARIFQFVGGEEKRLFVIEFWQEKKPGAAAFDNYFLREIDKPSQ